MSRRWEDKEGGKAHLSSLDFPVPVQFSMSFVAPVGVEGDRRVWGKTTRDQVTEEETDSAYVYKMDKPWLTREEVAVEIRWGRVLWVVGEGDETVKVKLPRSYRVKVSAATASMSDDGVLTVVVPKRDRPRKWYKYLGIIKFKTVHVPISS